MPALKSVLRNTLKKLERMSVDISDAYDRWIAPQEMLDFLALVAGLKPVYLGGRGWSSPRWLEDLERLSRGVGLHVIWGQRWSAIPENEGYPDWYTETNPTKPRQEPVLYVCRTRASTEDVRRVLIAGRPTIDEEARLLGYPRCCVENHYYRQRSSGTLVSLMLARMSGGLEDEMKRIVREDLPMKPTTEEEIRLSELCLRIRCAPFTNVIMCEPCALSSDSPAHRLSRRYAALAKDIDTSLFNRIEAMNEKS